MRVGFYRWTATFIHRVILGIYLSDLWSIAGSPQTVKEQVWRAIEESGINYFVSVFAWGNIPHQKAMRSMKYFAEEVMPGPR